MRVLRGPLLARVADLCPAAEFLDLSPILQRLRLVKSAAELAVMRRARCLTALAVGGRLRAVRSLRRVGLQGTELQEAQAGTLRLKLLKVGARVVRSVRRIVLHLSSGFRLQELFTQLARRLTALPALGRSPLVIPIG